MNHLLRAYNEILMTKNIDYCSTLQKIDVLCYCMYPCENVFLVFSMRDDQVNSTQAKIFISVFPDLHISILVCTQFLFRYPIKKYKWRVGDTS